MYMNVCTTSAFARALTLFVHVYIDMSNTYIEYTYISNIHIYRMYIYIYIEYVYL